MQGIVAIFRASAIIAFEYQIDFLFGLKEPFILLYFFLAAARVISVRIHISIVDLIFVILSCKIHPQIGIHS